MQITKSPSQNEKLSKMQAVSHAAKIFADEDAEARRTKQQPPCWAGILGSEGDTGSFWHPGFPPGTFPGFEHDDYDVQKQIFLLVSIQ